jgi:hypothetical protein
MVLLAVAIFWIPLNLFAIDVIFGLAISGIKDCTSWAGTMQGASRIGSVGGGLNSATTTNVGKAVEIGFGLWSIALVGIVIAVMNSLLITSWCAKLMDSRIDNSGLVFPIYVALFTPCVLVFASLVTGEIVAAVEGWSFETGFLHSMSFFAAAGDPWDPDPQTPPGSTGIGILTPLGIFARSKNMDLGGRGDLTPGDLDPGSPV